MTGWQRRQVVRTVGSRHGPGHQVPRPSILGKHSGAENCRAVHRYIATHAPELGQSGRLTIEPPGRGDFIARQAGLHVDSPGAVEQHRGAAHRRVFQANEMSDLVRRGAFDELFARVGVVEIGGPVELHTVENNIRLGLSVVVCEIGVERDSQRAADVVETAVDDRTVFHPENHVLIVAGVDVHARRDQAAILELQDGSGNRLPLREGGPHGVEFGNSVRCRISVGSQEEAHRPGQWIHHVGVNSLIWGIRRHGWLGRIEMPAQRIAAHVQFHDKCVGADSTSSQRPQKHPATLRGLPPRTRRFNSAKVSRRRAGG